MMSLKNFLFKDYEWEQQPYSNKKGYHWVYCYKGKWKQWNITDRELLRYKIMISFAFLLSVFSFFYSSTLLCDINRIKAVEVCTLLVFGSLFFLFIGVLYFTLSNTKMTVADAIMQKELILWSAGIGAVVLVLSNVFAIIFHELILTQEDVYVLIGNSVTIVLELIILVLQKRLNVKDT